MGVVIKLVFRLQFTGQGDLGRQVMQICRNGSDYRPVAWLDDDVNIMVGGLRRRKSWIRTIRQAQRG